MSQQQQQLHEEIQHDLQAAIQKAAKVLDPDDVRLLCWAAGVDVPLPRPIDYTSDRPF